MGIFTSLKEKIMLRRLGGEEFARRKGVKVGDHTRFISYPSFGSEPWLISIGDHVTISSNVTFITHDGATWCFRERPEYKNVIKYGKIEVKDNCFIGNRSMILSNWEGVTIGPNSVVGAGSIVTKSIPPNSVYAGIPAKYICSMDEYAQKCLERMPEYDIEAYRQDKRKEILRILDKK